MVTRGMIGYLYHYFLFMNGRYSQFFTLGIVSLVRGPNFAPFASLRVNALAWCYDLDDLSIEKILQS